MSSAIVARKEDVECVCVKCVNAEDNLVFCSSCDGVTAADCEKGYCGDCDTCGNCACECEEEEDEICARKCEDCSVKLSGDDEGDKCQDCLEQEDEEDEEEQRCPCGLVLSDDDLALESGKCESCTVKEQDELVEIYAASGGNLKIERVSHLDLERVLLACGDDVEKRKRKEEQIAYLRSQGYQI
jgi:hypothetical protein